jgi:hypothetical protein
VRGIDVYNDFGKEDKPAKIFGVSLPDNETAFVIIWNRATLPVSFAFLPCQRDGPIGLENSGR